MFARPRLWCLALGCVAALAIVVLLTLILTRPSPPTPLPSPNGHDDFLKAGTVVAGPVGDFPTLDHETLRDLVSTNAEALRLLRLGLTRQCVLPAEAAMTNTAGMMADLAGMKRLVQLLAAEGRLRELDNQPFAAAHSYLDAMRFGNEISRGGFLITRLVGIACEAIGRAALAKLVPSLSLPEARQVLAELEKMDGNRVSLDEVMRGERRYSYHAFRRLGNPIILVQSLWNLRPAKQRATERHNRNLALGRLLAAELALRCYLADKARSPARLEDLIPDYFSSVPQDPFSGQAMVYRPQGTNWLLYSIGADRMDNGGKPVARGLPSPGDLLYDAP